MMFVESFIRETNYLRSHNIVTVGQRMQVIRWYARFCGGSVGSNFVRSPSRDAVARDLNAELVDGAKGRGFHRNG